VCNSLFLQQKALDLGSWRGYRDSWRGYQADEGVQNFVEFRFSGTKSFKVENTPTNWLKRETHWQRSEKVQKKKFAMKISKRKVKRALVHKSMMGSKPWIGGWNLYPRVSRTSIRWGAGSIPWHPVVVKIWVVQIEISQERLGISKPRKKDPVEWGTSISAASKYSPVRSVIPTHYKNVKCTRVFFLDFLLFLLLLRHHTASLSRGNVFFG